MVRIAEYRVVEPATSEDVRAQALAALGSKRGRGVLRLMLQRDQDVPRGEPIAVAFRIGHTVHPEDEGGSLSGRRVLVKDDREGGLTITPLPSTVTVHLAETASEPSTASMTEVE